MRRLTVAVAAAALAAACGPEPPAPPASPASQAAPAGQPGTAAGSGTGAGLPGQAVYEQACAGCHDAGAGGAPRIGEMSDWADRSDLWQAVLFEHARKGYLAMPAKGGAEGISEADVAAAAEYMLERSFPERSGDPR